MANEAKVQVTAAAASGARKQQQPAPTEGHDAVAAAYSYIRQHVTTKPVSKWTVTRRTVR